MNKLPILPNAPEGVKYTLTVPQSVLFAELSLRGSMRGAFEQAMCIDYEPDFIAIDAGGAMSWNNDEDANFNKALLKNGKLEEAIRRFIDTMDRTSRWLQKVSNSIESSKLRRSSNSDDILEDLEMYWQAYMLHMTSLFTFWNAEKLLTVALKNELENYTNNEQKKPDLDRFFRPNETNYFVLERLQLQKIKARFASKTESTTAELIAALKAHRDSYGFLLAPFNTGSPLSIELLVEQMDNLSLNIATFEIEADDFADLPANVRNLAVLARQLAFWKTERLDALALADSKASSLYREAAAKLDVSLDYFFAMTSLEIIESLRKGRLTVPRGTLATRQKAYCMALISNKVSFYMPSAAEHAVQANISEGTTISGVGASLGKLTGRVCVVKSKNDLNGIREGDVLVTKMTRPEYGIALDKATAYVTDEGGMLCHAAIIAREMKKPCIIATNNATKVLKTGMLVEVDAEKGLIRVLELAHDPTVIETGRV